MLRGRVVFNNSKRKKERKRVMRHGDKRMWVNLWWREDQMSEDRDGQQEAQTGKMHQE